jgi:hypothetical protein
LDKRGGCACAGRVQNRIRAAGPAAPAFDMCSLRMFSTGVSCVAGDMETLVDVTGRFTFASRTVNDGRPIEVAYASSYVTSGVSTLGETCRSICQQHGVQGVLLRFSGPAVFNRHFSFPRDKALVFLKEGCVGLAMIPTGGVFVCTWLIPYSGIQGDEVCDGGVSAVFFDDSVRLLAGDDPAFASRPDFCRKYFTSGLVRYFDDVFCFSYWFGLHRPVCSAGTMQVCEKGWMSMGIPGWGATLVCDLRYSEKPPCMVCVLETVLEGDTVLLPITAVIPDDVKGSVGLLYYNEDTQEVTASSGGTETSILLFPRKNGSSGDHDGGRAHVKQFVKWWSPSEIENVGEIGPAMTTPASGSEVK